MKEKPEDAVPTMKLDPRDLRRIGEHVRRGMQTELLILKAHLLVEAGLRELLRRSARAPDERDAERLGYHRLALVVKGLHGRAADERLWEVTLELNAIRNELAHSLETRVPLTRFEALLDKACDEAAIVSWNGAPTPADRIGTATMVLLAWLRGLGDVAEGDA